MANHYSDDRLLAALYEADANDGHLAGCEECRARLDRMRSARDRSGAEQEVSPAFLAAQRARVREALERPRRRWVPVTAVSAMAGVSALAIVLFVNQPGPENKPQVSDAQFFAEISAVVEREEPRAATPIRGLFEESQ